MVLLKINHDKLIKEKLDICIERACKDLYLNDYYLIVNGDHGEDHVTERSIVFRLGIYLDKYLSKYKSLNKYHLDSEYNRSMNDLKRVAFRPDGCSPDLIIHRRGSNNYNLLIIECKGWWSQRNKIKEDQIKIQDFINDKEFNYKFGLQIIFKKDGVKLEWIDKM